jgi:hypothetical protein
MRPLVARRARTRKVGAERRRASRAERASVGTAAAVEGEGAAALEGGEGAEAQAHTPRIRQGRSRTGAW